MRWAFLANWQIRGCIVVARLYRSAHENGGHFGHIRCAIAALVRVWDNLLKFSYMPEYFGTPKAKARRNREYKVSLRERAMLRLLDASTDRNEAIFRVY